MAVLSSQSFKYEATWAAANFKITPPTPKRILHFLVGNWAMLRKRYTRNFGPLDFSTSIPRAHFNAAILTFEVSATTVKDPLLAVDSARDLQNSGGNECSLIGPSGAFWISHLQIRMCFWVQIAPFSAACGGRSEHFARHFCTHPRSPYSSNRYQSSLLNQRTRAMTKNCASCLIPSATRGLVEKYEFRSQGRLYAGDDSG